MVALNYQTIDSFQILNLAMFEQNCNTGYVLKPSVLWDKQHPEYGRVNPFEKKKENEYPTGIACGGCAVGLFFVSRSLRNQKTLSNADIIYMYKDYSLTHTIQIILIF